ncbi:hypothetical protein [Qipengyuania sp. MTN3-11]|uniref:hypothetical protein n=1 Tax=Qipengyuania sp. MTN3-11 TaxID=3056557 RepID=UPI0036F20E82
MLHIPVTHVGSTPRGEALTPLLLARNKGEPYDEQAFDQIVTQPVTDCVAMQRECGVDFVSDGELGKVGYSTYMTERLSGFGGHVDRKLAADIAETPERAKRLSSITGSQELKGSG